MMNLIMLWSKANNDTLGPIELWNGRRLLDLNYAFKQSNEHETQQVCSLYTDRYILFNNLNFKPLIADGGPEYM